MADKFHPNSDTTHMDTHTHTQSHRPKTEMFKGNNREGGWTGVSKISLLGKTLNADCSLRVKDHTTQQKIR